MTDLIDTVQVADSARMRICVDFDKTLVAWAGLHEIPPFLPGAIAFLDDLEAMGFEVVILTSRASPTWWLEHLWHPERSPSPEEVDDFGRSQIGIVFATLDKVGKGGLLITAEKVPALAYIDDRAITFSPLIGFGAIIDQLKAAML